MTSTHRTFPALILPLLAAAALVAGCPTPLVDAGPSDSGAGPETPLDAGGADAGRLDAGPVALDAGTLDAGPADAGQEDAGQEDAGQEDAGQRDAGATDAGAADAGTDAGPTDAGGIDLGPVQCRENDDCGGALTCTRSAPGGICSGCGTCPGSLECVFGACVRGCNDDDGCNLGFRCLGSGRCALRSCDADTPCPGPYVCGPTDQCQRPECGVNDSCPAPLTCLGSRCVEP